MLNFWKNLWNSNWRNKATVIFAAVVLVGAIVGVAYGVGCQG